MCVLKFVRLVAHNKVNQADQYIKRVFCTHMLTTIALNDLIAVTCSVYVSAAEMEVHHVHVYLFIFLCVLSFIFGVEIINVDQEQAKGK